MEDENCFAVRHRVFLNGKNTIVIDPDSDYQGARLKVFKTQASRIKTLVSHSLVESLTLARHLLLP